MTDTHAPPLADDPPQTGDSFILYTDATFAIADAWATAKLPDKPSNAYQKPAPLIFISMAAAQHAIKAVRPLMRSGKMNFGHLQPLSKNSVQPEPSGRIDPNGLKAGSFYETRLPKMPGAPITSHLIAIARHPGKLSRRSGEHHYEATGVYVFAKSANQLSKAYYRHFKEHSTLPTIPEWADHIWDFVVRNSMAVQLPSSSNIHAWQCEINDYLLSPIITDAVQKGQLPIP